MTARTVSEIMAELKADMLAENPNLCDWSLNSMLRKTHIPIAIQIQKLETRIDAAGAAQNPNTATGSDLDDLVKDRGLTRLGGTKAVGQVAFVRSTVASADIIIPLGTEVGAQDTDGEGPVYFVTTEEVTLLTGTTSIAADVEASDPGARGNVRAAAISFISGGLSGVDYVTNPVEFTGGADTESDADLRQRYIATATEYGRATVPTMKEWLELVEDDGLKIVREAKVYNKGQGDVEIIVDTTPTEGNIALVGDAVEECIAAGVCGRGMLAAHIGLTSDDLITGEVFSEINGVLTTFVADYPFVTGSEVLKLNGIAQLRGVHYNATPSTGTIEILWTPIPDAAAGDVLTLDYVKAGAPGNIGDLGDAAGGQLWLRPLKNITANDAVSLNYINQDGATHTATVTVPAGTVQGDAVKMTLQELTDEVISIPDPPEYIGNFEYNVLIGYGDYPNLFLLPELVAIDVVLTYTPTDTPETDLDELIEDSIKAFLGDFAIGETLQFSDLYDAARYQYTAGVGFGDRFEGIDSIDSISATDGTTTITALGQTITVESDARIEAGTVSAAVTT